MNNNDTPVRILARRIEHLERALYAIALDAKTLETAQYLAAAVLFHAPKPPPNYPAPAHIVD